MNTLSMDLFVIVDEYGNEARIPSGNVGQILCIITTSRMCTSQGVVFHELNAKCLRSLCCLDGAEGRISKGLGLDDAERYMWGYEAYEQFLAMSNQEVGGSGSGSAPKWTWTYIPREREEAEQCLIDDYFGDDETPLKYSEENFRQAVADQKLWIWYAFFGVPGVNNDLNVLYGSPLFDDVLADTALEAPFVVNGRTYKKGYYLADGIYPTWSTFVKTYFIARDEKTLKFKKSLRKFKKRY
ncbi:reverse transcriptase domain-containing protein [Tanacetum coccineum]